MVKQGFSVADEQTAATEAPNQEKAAQGQPAAQTANANDTYNSASKRYGSTDDANKETPKVNQPTAQGVEPPVVQTEEETKAADT